VFAQALLARQFPLAVDPKLGGAGFKNFRPIVAQQGHLRQPAQRRDRGPLGTSAGSRSRSTRTGSTAFYDQMDAPCCRPSRSIRSARCAQMIDALDEQGLARACARRQREDYVAKNKARFAMPDGAAIFETGGAWEDYATPSRESAPADRDRRGARLRGPVGASRSLRAGTGCQADQVRRALDGILADELSTRSFTYRRSDGATRPSTSSASIIWRSARSGSSGSGDSMASI